LWPIFERFVTNLNAFELFFLRKIWGAVEQHRTVKNQVRMSTFPAVTSFFCWDVVGEWRGKKSQLCDIGRSFFLRKNWGWNSILRLGCWKPGTNVTFPPVTSFFLLRCCWRWRGKKLQLCDTDRSFFWEKRGRVGGKVRGKVLLGTLFLTSKCATFFRLRTNKWSVGSRLMETPEGTLGFCLWTSHFFIFWDERAEGEPERSRREELESRKEGDEWGPVTFVGNAVFYQPNPGPSSKG